MCVCVCVRACVRASVCLRMYLCCVCSSYLGRVLKTRWVPDAAATVRLTWHATMRAKTVTNWVILVRYDRQSSTGMWGKNVSQQQAWHFVALVARQWFSYPLPLFTCDRSMVTFFLSTVTFLFFGSSTIWKRPKRGWKPFTCVQTLWLASRDAENLW